MIESGHFSETPRSCRGCGDWFESGDEAPQMPHMVALRDKIRRELYESQRKFAYEMEKRLEEAMNADSRMPPRSVTALQLEQEKSESLPSERSDSILSRWTKADKVSVDRRGSYNLLALAPGRERARKEATELQAKWIAVWLEEAESGELDVYTCLGLSNCFSWTPDTRKILAKAIAVTFMQLLVPCCLLLAEFDEGFESGPAVGDLGFRLTGITLYAYAIYSLFMGASDHCRTSLLNVMFLYSNVSSGMWLPLVMGEISNIFTAIVLAFALYSIFTTQTAPADLILNAVAVNFLGDCDGNFVDREMKEDAIHTFKEFTEELFTSPVKQADDPESGTCIVKVVNVAMYLISIAGVVGCAGFLLCPEHDAGHLDTKPGFGRNIVDFKKVNGLLVPVDPSHPGL